MLNFDVPDLYVKDYDNVFPGKQEALLNALKSVEKEHGKDQKDAPVKVNKAKSNSRNRRISTRSYRNQESIFKVPEVPFRVSNIRRSMFKSNARSGKWTKYDLSNVADMSDSLNAQVAFSFMKELEDRKQKSEETEATEPGSFKPIFKKRELKSDKDCRINVQSTKDSSVPSKPEIELKSKGHSSSGAIKLDHLNFDDVE